MHAVPGPAPAILFLFLAAEHAENGKRRSSVLDLCEISLNRHALCRYLLTRNFFASCEKNYIASSAESANLSSAVAGGST
jgi:hypothetical protein